MRYTSIIVAMAGLLFSCTTRDFDPAKDKFELYARMSEKYEEKNLTEQQQEVQSLMLEEALADGDSARIAESYQRRGAASMVGGDNEQAIEAFQMACQYAPSDSTSFLSQSLLMLCQIYMQVEQHDSSDYYLKAAAEVCPDIRDTDLFRLSNAFVLSNIGTPQQVLDTIAQYLPMSELYTQAELYRLQAEQYEGMSDWRNAYLSAQNLQMLTDSIRDVEASESMAQIHTLHHESMMEQARNKMLSQRLRYGSIIAVTVVALLVACLLSLLFHRRAKVSHQKELEAMQLAEAAQADAEQYRAENVQMHKLYYEHLYAILLPILNACRTKTGKINLEETEWNLIEQNTDSVIPGFSKKLIRNHPSLTKDDIRFCCLIMMRVPNAVMADIYGIAPSSVSVRKQRMKNKLENDMQEQTLENYLNQYML